MEASARDGDLLELDSLSMAEWMAAEGYRSERLRWYVDYGCRDDFGCSLADTSAWAAIHYFACREDAEVLTWPEGNGRLAGALSKNLGPRIVTGALVHRIEETADGVVVEYLEADSGRTVRVDCRYAVAALPRFVARRVMAGMRRKAPIRIRPWMVANLQLSRPGKPPDEAPLSWDNVPYRSPSLGYVRDAPGPGRGARPDDLDYYRPFAGEDRQVRTDAGDIAEAWRDGVLADLSRPIRSTGPPHGST